MKRLAMAERAHRALTKIGGAAKIQSVPKIVAPLMMALAALTVTVSDGCGMVYRAHTEVRASHMLKQLQPGQTSLSVHEQWGEPDIRNYLDQHTVVWSYAEKANTNDVTAAMLYTAPKEGDSGRFLDLKFTDGRLASWAEAEHQMPQKEGSSYGFGVNGGMPATHY